MVRGHLFLLAQRIYICGQAGGLRKGGREQARHAHCALSRAGISPSGAAGGENQQIKRVSASASALDSIPTNIIDAARRRSRRPNGGGILFCRLASAKVWSKARLFFSLRLRVHAASGGHVASALDLPPRAAGRGKAAAAKGHTIAGRLRT